MNTPAWFTDAIEEPREDRFVEVDGCPIHYLAWGPAGANGIVFVHGGGAHAHWWTHVAARFARDYRVAALDLSGHGDSGRRDRYSMEAWTDEVAAVIADAEMSPQPIVVGHSMGGFVTIATGSRHGERLKGIIVCDSPVTEPDPEVEAFNLRKAFGTPKVYPDVETAIARFRTVPPQAHYLDYVMDNVARHSLHAVEGGYGWKFDPAVFMQFTGGIRGAALPYLDSLNCRMALLRSENGLVTENIGAFMYERSGRVTPVVELPEAGHHSMLDEPLILLTAIRSLLADWDHSDPHRRHA